MSTFDAKSLRDKDDNDVNFTPTHYFDGNTKKNIATEMGKKYEKPSNGITRSDLSSSVQSSLDKADTALQNEDLPTPYYSRIIQAPMGTELFLNQTSTNKITQADIDRLYFDFLVPNKTGITDGNYAIVALKLFDLYRKDHTGDHPVLYSIHGTFESVTIFSNDGRIGDTGNRTNFGTFALEPSPNDITDHIPIKFFDWGSAWSHFNIRLNMRSDRTSYIHIGDDIFHSLDMMCWRGAYPSINP